MAYLWRNLSDHDFELVCRDLFAKVVDEPLEAFARGPDSGIDVRGYHNGTLSLVIQCKHYAGSPFSSLQSAVRKELPKLKALNPQPKRVILAVSRGLTPANKASLADLLGPYARQEDIFGEDDLEGLLQLHQDVENHHYKLWLASGNRLAAIANAAVVNRSEAVTDRLIAKSRIFVQHQKLQDARVLLDSEHCCVISGPAGVGKTTLAEMLALEYLAAEFELVEVSADIEEAMSVWRRGNKQIFLYDDFLGRTNLLPALGKNEDQRLLNFIRGIKDADNKRFILTTREYILRAARQRYDNLQDDLIDMARLTLDMSSYSRLERAEILYNHLYFNEHVTRQDLETLVENRSYMNIIDHSQFNPRLIESAIRLATKAHV
jgi:hypothetical protein